MPPKSPNKGTRGTPQEEPKPDDGSERELMEKELVIAYMKSKLGRYQANGDRLQLENIRLGEDLDIQRLNLRDINEFLTNELKARSLTTNALEAKLYDLNQSMEEQRKNHEVATSKLRAEKDKEIGRQADIILEYDKKAKIMQDHIENKERMDAELASLKSEIETMKMEFDHKLIDVDRQHIQDREKWKRETASKIKETKIKMMKLTDNQLEMTTKRTIMENEQMSVELSYQSRQTEKLMSKNTMLVEENADLRRQLGLSKQTEEELARRNNVYQRTIKSLLTKLDEQGTLQESNGTVVKALEDQASDLESQLSLLRLQLEEQQHHTREVQNQLSTKNTEYEALCNSYDSTAQFLIQCMDDVRSKLPALVKTGEPQHTAQPPSPAAAPQSYHQQQHHHHRSLSRTGSGASSVSAGPSSVVGPLVEAQTSAVQPDITVLPGRLDELSPEQRECVLAHLLERLHVQATSVSSGQPVPGVSSAPHNTAPSVVLPPIPKYARRNHAASTPISQQLIPGPNFSHAHPSGSHAPSGTHSVYTSSQFAPSRYAGSQAGTVASGPPAPVVVPLQSQQQQQQPLATVMEDVGVAGSQVSAKMGASSAPVNASWPQTMGAPSTAAGSVRSGGAKAQAGLPHKSGPGSVQDGHSTIEVGSQSPVDELEGMDEAAVAGDMLTGEQLVSKVMSDVRPWGKRAPDVPTAATNSMNRKNGVFLKRGAAIGASKHLVCLPQPPA